MEASNSTGGAYQADAHGRPLLRPLLPALSPDPVHDTPMLKGMVRRTGVPARAACHACRRRKSRCSGGRPKCASCQARNVDCVYDTASKGETRVQALKRKFVELNEKDSSHRKVYDLLATLPLPEARALFDRLRQTDGADTLLRLFNDGDLLVQLKLTPESRSRYEFPYRREMPATVMEFDNPYLNSLVYECSLRNSGTHDSLETIDVAFEAYRDMYLKPFHAATVVDPLLDAVEPSKWTNVSKDDALMRRILAAYFMNEYQSLPAFHKDYFLKDMAEGRHRFCSRLLVNTVLAMGCICYNAIPKRYEHWNPQNLVYQFMNEAKRLWELEAHKLKLTTIQAGPILNVIHNMCCQDKLGWAYTMQSVTMAHSLGLFSPASRSPSSRQYTKREQDARDFTAWCIFTFQTLHCLLLFDAPLMLKPPDIPLPDPTTDADWYSEVWFKYPTRDRLCPASFGQLFRARAAIRVITNDILLACYGDHTPTRHLSIEQASMFNYRLEAWYNALPRVLNAKKSVLPSHLLLHINYQNVLINIHGPFLQAGPFADGYDPYLSREAALMRLETLLRLYYLRHGFEVADAFVIQPLSLMAFENLQKLQANPYGPRSDAIRSSLILAAKGLWDQGQSCYVSRTTLCLLRKRLLQQGPSELQAEAELQTLDKESNITIEPDAAHHMQIREVRSRWPPSMHSITDDPEGQRLSALVERYMSIEGDSDSEDEGDRRDDFMDDDNGYGSTHEQAAVQAELSGRSPGTMTTNTSTTQVESPS